MDKTISTETIQSTFTYINLGNVDPKQPLLNNKMNQQFLLKRASRKLITESLIIYNNTKQIPSNITAYQLQVLKELIESNYKI